MLGPAKARSFRSGLFTKHEGLGVVGLGACRVGVARTEVQRDDCNVTRVHGAVLVEVGAALRPVVEGVGLDPVAYRDRGHTRKACWGNRRQASG